VFFFALVWLKYIKKRLTKALDFQNVYEVTVKIENTMLLRPPDFFLNLLSTVKLHKYDQHLYQVNKQGGRYKGTKGYCITLGKHLVQRNSVRKSQQIYTRTSVQIHSNPIQMKCTQTPF